MEFYQTVQNRAMETIAVVNTHLPALVVAGIPVGTYQSLTNNINGTALARDIALSAYDGAVNAENLGFLLLRNLGLALPEAAESELMQENEKDAKQSLLLHEVYGITPRSTESALKRAKKAIAALTRINTYLATQIPPRGPITSGGKGLAHLIAADGAQPSLEQAVENTLALANEARNTLDTEATAVDRINKRFYKRLQAEARTNPALAAALSQITTDSENLPGTLSIKTILQGGLDQLHILVSYVNGTGSNADDRLIEWMVEGVDTDFVHSAEVDLSGNALGPFLVGQTVKIRTRTVNSSGSRTCAVRTLVILAVG